MNKTVLVLSILLGLFIIGSVIAEETGLDELLQRILSLEERIAYLEFLEGIEPPEDLCEGKVCEDSELTCEDNYVATCNNNCNGGVCSECEPDCSGHEDLCEGIVCEGSELTCEDDYVATCNNDCNGGVCSTCEPDCSGHEEIPKKVIIFQMDDTQCWWLEDISEDIINMHVDKDIPLVVATIPENLDNVWCTLKNKLYTWSTYSQIEISDHGYDHRLSDAGIGCYGVESDKQRIAKGLELFQSIGITPTSYSPTGGEGWSQCGWTEDTLQALDELGYHTFLAGGFLEDWWNHVEINSMLTLDDGVYLCANDGDDDCRSFKSYSVLKSKIDEKLQDRDVVVVTFHQQDFQSLSKIQTYSDILDSLKSSNEYNFMTAEEYYQSIN